MSKPVHRLTNVEDPIKSQFTAVSKTPSKPTLNSHPFVKRTRKNYTSAMILSDMLNNRQPQTGTAGFLRPRFIRAIKPLKHAAPVFLRDPDTGVGYNNSKSIAFL